MKYRSSNRGMLQSRKNNFRVGYLSYFSSSVWSS